MTVCRYCQGMSGVCGVLLMYVEEEDAFWVLDQLMRASQYRLEDVFRPRFPGLLELAFVHEQLLQRHLPQLAAHLAAEHLQTLTYATRWYMSLFVENLP